MNTLTYLVIGLGFMAGVYVLYRITFLKKPKQNPPKHPHFTLKIDTE